MKNILITGIIALTALTGCEKWSLFERREPIDEIALYNQQMQQMFTDSLASEEWIEIVTFMQHDSTYYFNHTPWEIQNSDFKISLIEDVRSYAVVSILEVTPSEEQLQIHHERNYHGQSEGEVDVIDSIVCTDVLVPYEYIDSALVLVSYHTTDEGATPWHITQEVDDTYWCPSYWEEERCVKNVLQVYLNDWTYYAVTIERNVIYP